MHALIRSLPWVIFWLFCALSPLWAAHYRVAIIGTGLAGLNAAHELSEKHGIDAALFEARNRSGGCVYTTDLPKKNAHLEHGGCFIDSDHENIIQLATTLGCTLTRVINDEEALYHQLLDKELSTCENNFAKFKQTLSDIAPDMIMYGSKDRALMAQLKNSTIAEYLASKNAPPELVRLIGLIIENEYGADLENMWAYKLFEVISLDMKKEHFRLNGKLGDEAFIIKDGGKALVQKLELRLRKAINYEHELVSISEIDNYYLLKFKTPTGIITIESDYVIITIPPEVLHKSVVFEFKEFPAYLQEFISQRHLGNNIKIFLYFSKPGWNKLEIGNRFNFLTKHFWISDNGDEEQGHDLFNLTAFAGGSNALRASALIDDELEKEILDDLSMLIPDIRSHHVMTIKGHNWLKDPYSQGSYAGIIQPGLYPIEEAYAYPYYNNLFFAGSAWDKKREGFMDGAVASGKAAAQRVFDRMNNK